MNATATVGGALINTDETGAAGILINAVAFTAGDRGVQDGDTVNVTCTLTASSA